MTQQELTEIQQKFKRLRSWLEYFLNCFKKTNREVYITKYYKTLTKIENLEKDSKILLLGGSVWKRKKEILLEDVKRRFEEEVLNHRPYHIAEELREFIEAENKGLLK